MYIKRKGVAPLVVVLIIAGLIGGAGAGYAFREPIKKAVSGKSTTDEINDAVNTAKEQEEAGKSKFELEGVAVEVDSSQSQILVKIKSSTASIKEMRLSEAPIKITEKTEISFNNEKNLKITGIPIDSQVHVGGTIAEGVLTATTVLIQKEDADDTGQGEKTKFSLGGTVNVVGTDSLKVLVSTANKLAKDKKDKEIEIKITQTTIIEKGDTAINLAEIKVNDNVQIVGVLEESNYVASKVEVKVKEQAGELEETQTQNSGDDQNIETQNQEKNQTPAADKSNNSNKNKNIDTDPETE